MGAPCRNQGHGPTIRPAGKVRFSTFRPRRNGAGRGRSEAGLPVTQITFVLKNWFHDAACRPARHVNSSRGNSHDA